MNWQPYLQLVLILSSLIITSAFGVLAWTRRHVPAARPFAVLTFFESVWAFGLLCEIIAPNLEVKRFFDNIELASMSFIALALLAFALEFTGQRLPHARMLWITTVTLSVLTTLVFLTDPYHDLVRENVRLVSDAPFDWLVYDFTLLDWTVFFFDYGIVVASLSLLASAFNRSQALYRDQIMIILTAILIPVAGTMLGALDPFNSNQRDVAPVSFGLSNIVAVWGLFRYRLFDVTPIARERVIEDMRAAVVVLDTQYRVIDLNPAAEQLAKRSALEAVGEPVQRLFASWPTLENHLDIGADGHIQIVENTGDQTQHFDLSVSPLRDHRQKLTGHLLVAHNVTERQNIEDTLRQRTVESAATNRELEAANERLRVLSRIKDEFVTNVSHELRTPITNLKLRYHLLTAQPERLNDHLPVIRRETNRLADLIEGLLTLSRLDQDRVPFHRCPVDLNTLVQEYVSDRSALAGERGLSMTLECAPALPVVQADHRLIGQVVSILLTNALNYTPSGGHVSVRTYTQCINGQQWAAFCVQDTGPGITPDEQARLFTRFFRGKIGLESGVSGTGLGLAIAHEIVTQHKGRIRAESDGTPGSGAIFHVWLPGEPIDSAGGMPSDEPASLIDPQTFNNKTD
ncbi:MAG: PAS domain-containing protein [Anaerolineae bacterium]|nr:PAS domain-containing protein [Anaerolineae bacterium]